MNTLRNILLLGIVLLPLAPARADDKLSKFQFESLTLNVPASWLKHADAKVVPAAPLYDAESTARWKANPLANLKPEYPVMPQHVSVEFEKLPFYSGKSYEFSPEIMTHPVDAFTRIFDPENKPSPDVIAEFDLIKKLAATASDHPTANPLPFIPFLDASQHVTVCFRSFSFANGKGFRFVTQYGYEAGLLNESQLVYIFQGITDDGKTYVLATFPVSLKGLPKTDDKEHLGFTTNSNDDFELNQDKYYSKATNWLVKNADQMTPSLETLDAVMSSIKTTPAK